MTTECLNKFVLIFKCKLSKLASIYYNQVSLGDSCSETTLFKLALAKALLNSIKCEDFTCLTEEEVCIIIDNLKKLFKDCACGCPE